MSSLESASTAATRDAISADKLAVLAQEIEAALAEGKLDVLAPETVQALMAIACRVYSAQNDEGRAYLPLAGDSKCTATDVMMTTSGLLRAANLQVFELGMWVSYTGR